MKKVLVTGAAGSIGNLVIKYLLSEGKYEITAIDLKNKNTYQVLKRYRRRINIIYGDITDPILTDALVKDHDYIIHLAGVLPPLANINKELMEVVDYKATENIIRAMEFYNKNCELLYASSTSIYDNLKNSEVTIQSKTTTNNLDYYSQSKIDIEKMISKKHKNHIIFRLPLVLSDLSKNDFLYNGVSNEYIEVITAEDAAYAFVKALDNVPSLNGKKYNLSGGESCRTTYKDILINILKYYGLSWRFIRSRLFNHKDFHGFIYKDSDKLENILHFRNDSILSYFMRQKRKHKNRKFNIIMAKPLLKLFYNNKEAKK
ncbi:MAG: NAD(P)-dependent oxidoreductase [Bacilli bacterium]|nr:NAD(P)-dependent oxidoreductase [Bacilli bacterium]